MGKKRQIDSDIYHDTWFSELEALEQHFFMYLITNSHTNLIGVFEVTMRTMEFESRLKKKDIQKMLEKMNEKVRYEDGFIVMRNAIKHQNYNNPQINKAIETLLFKCPDRLLEYVNLPSDFGKSKEKYIGKQMQLDVKATEVNDESSMSHDESSHSILFNSILFNSIQPAVPSGSPAAPESNKFDRAQKRNYAKAVKHDEAQAERAQRAKNRPPGKTQSIDEVF